ncbi:alpha/beta fold hydrolase [Corynebacterium sp. TAE3-ERU12]|uniref:alpha/beta fold hydrolase n=1 Tax=Corynebacterium sp. TAE3-ERU12 TaxID=2849491 RepID=UPI001C48CEE7|nr:alpha/beta fold hydrolase [Corynebacterium sp. TAE3-ERU12]MBV7295708.1 alpha/beta fold hydrolase [Corynebacterium sp. TAE3-ERU12]
MLAYTEQGPTDAPVVVLLGSLGASRAMWQPQLAALSDSFHIIAVDLRGHGESEAPEGPYTMQGLADDVLALMDHLGVTAVHLTGLSLGGAVAQTIALSRPDIIASLTLISTAPKFGESDAWLAKADLVTAQSTAELADTVVGNWFTEHCFNTDPALPGRFADGIRETSDTGYAGCCHAIAGFDSRIALAGLDHRVARRTLVIAGEQDTSTAIDVVRSLHEIITGSEMATISPAKHLVTVEKAHLVNPLLAAHWSRG